MTESNLKLRKRNLYPWAFSSNIRMILKCVLTFDIYVKI